VNPTCKISKSKFMAGLQCAKRGYLQVRHPELASSVDDSRMQQGIEVGSLARQTFAGGVLVAADHKHLSDAIRDTRELIANREVHVIFEATFERSGVLVRADVLKRNATGFHLTEVKSSTKVKPEYTDDVSIQKYVMGGCGVQVKVTNVMHLSRDYVYDGAVGADGRRVYDVSRLFATEEVQPQSDGQVTRTLDEQFRVLAQPQPPNVEPSSQCNSPYYCEFYDHCHPVWGDGDIRSLPIAGCKIEALRDAGITSIDQLPGLIALRERFHLTKMENTLPQAGAIRMLGTAVGPVSANLKLPMIATCDIGAAAADALVRLAFRGKQTQELQGQRDLNYTEATTIIGKAIGKPDLGYIQAPDNQVRAAMVQMGMSENFAGLILELAAALNAGHMRALEPRTASNTTPTKFETFVAESFVPAYQQQAAA
jgi:hypothetical protein